MTNQPEFVPVILAGGSGTRFWPRSRKARAKQVLALSGEETMIQQTVDRLRPLASADCFLVITNDLLVGTIQDQLPSIPAARILCEPAARNTAPACLLAAALMLRQNPKAVLGIFPSDHVVIDEAKFIQRMQQAIHVAAAGENIVVLGAPPTRAETGYGYIDEGAAVNIGDAARDVHAVRRFTEKPDFAHARKFISAGNYTWNSGIFLWSAQTLVNAFREHCPSMLPPIEAIANAFDTPDFDRVFAEEYPAIENISIDFAILESRSFKGEGKSNIYCLPADFGWNDLGSWSALHEHYLQHIEDIGNNNVIESGSALQLDASGNYVYAPGLTVALLGVNDLVVVQTEDALLVTTRAHSQEVGRVVKELVKHARHEMV